MTKTVLLSTALFVSMASTSVFAHHPAADRVDPEIYAMIDENVSDTPHADMTFDDMLRDMEASSEMEARGEMEERGQSGSREAMTDAASDSFSDAADERATDAAEQAVDIDTIDTLDNVASLMEQ